MTKGGNKIFLFGLPIFLGAFFLFQMQPLLARYILPWFGGGAAVWTISLVFFQTVLVLGYAFAYFSSRYLNFKSQALSFVVLLLLAILFLPIIPDEGWKPRPDDWPALRILLLLGATAGLPYFILSTVSALFQGWFSRFHGGFSVYKFYALSNIGSLLALATYPVFFEPFFNLKQQSIFWSVGFAVFAAVALFLVFKTVKSGNLLSGTIKETDSGELVSSGTKTLWLVLAGCGTLLLLSVTNEITQNLPPVPFLWVLTLGIYLLSFVVCFGNARWYSRQKFIWLFAVPLLFLALIFHFNLQFSVFSKAILFFAVLFGGCMMCHGELVKLRPIAGQRRLTEFYFFIAIGGALGGLFAGVVSPVIFPAYLEFYAAIFLITGLIFAFFYRDRELKFFRSAGIFAGAALIISSVIFINDIAAFLNGAVFVKRSFYGVLAVFEEGKYTEKNEYLLLNGSTVHGIQYRDISKRKLPTAYFSKESGLGLLMDALAGHRDLKIGVIGLGVGTVAAYGRDGDKIKFYEINPDVWEAAEKYFTYLKDSAASTEVVLGDARLSLEKEPPQNFDVFVLDAFNSDSIPVHLLTKEAMALYFSHMKDDGVFAFHISNNCFDLEPVVRGLAGYFGWRSAYIVNPPDNDNGIFLSDWVLVTKNEKILYNEKIKTAVISAAGGEEKKEVLWTDDYSNLFGVLGPRF